MAADLLRDLLRARALETLMGGTSPEDGPTRRISPGVPAAHALRASEDGTGDVFSQRVGSPASALCLGVTPLELMRQHRGLSTAPASGRDPGGFPTDLARGLLGPVPLPGALMEVMAGVALSFRMRGEDRAALLVDDTAGTASGDWHEGLNFAAVGRVPLVLVVDDSGRWEDGAAASPSMGERAEAYGFAHRTVADTDPREIRRETSAALDRARAGDGVQVLEVTASPGAPEERLAAALREEGALSDTEWTSMQDAVAAEIEEAVDALQGEPVPDFSAVLPFAGDPVHSRLAVPRTPRPWS